MSGLPVDWAALNLDTVSARRPGIAATCLESGQCVKLCQLCGGYPHSAPPVEVEAMPRKVLDATREIYRALKIHHTTARMAALALYHAGLLK